MRFNTTVKLLKLFILLSPVCRVDAQVTSCSTYNLTFPPQYVGSNSSKQHISDDHVWANTMNGSCYYTGYAQLGATTPCAITASSTSSSSADDSGVTVPYFHTANSDDKGGSANSNGPQITTDAEGAAAVSSCLLLPCGAPVISITGSTTIGWTVTDTPTSGSIIWQPKQSYSTTCAAKTLAALKPGSCPFPSPPYPPYPPEQGFTWVWNPATCQWDIVPDGESPIFIDTKGNFVPGQQAFSDPSKGNYVTFDMRGDGKLEKFSWPLPNSGLGWLALPDEGVITNGTQLFGNFTPHSSPAGWKDYPNPNGFVALAWYDQYAQGGDLNAIIDKRDAVWVRLKLWIDEHCYKQPDAPCSSLPEELHTLESMGVNSISLSAGGNYLTDSIGNVYKFFSVVNPIAENQQQEQQDGPLVSGVRPDGSVVTVNPDGSVTTFSPPGNPLRQSKDGRLAYDVWLKRVDTP